MSEKPSIDIQSPSTDFQDHLNLPDNQRIFFSGPFGIGKTYFLKKFFEERKDKYSVIHIYPVNYSVAQNEDIFELIKYDVLYSLLNFPEIFEAFEIGTSIKASEFAKTKIPGLLSGFLNGFDHINKESFEQNTILQAIKLLVPMLEDYKRFSEETDKALSDFGLTDDFRKSIESKTGSIYENNIVTQLITKLIERLRKLAESEREVILIIDDLDRVDPEHIFRILNVFAAHFDIDSSENKFGFDKIIVVADYQNTKSIFNHKLGINADFNGYVDKFYTIKPFRFDNRAAVNKWVSDNFKLKQQDQKLLNTILLALISSNLISLRQLFKFDFSLNMTNELEKTEMYWLSAHVRILANLFGDDEKLVDSIARIDRSFPKNWQGYKDEKQIAVWCRIFVFAPLVEAFGDLPLELSSSDQEVEILIESTKLSLKRDSVSPNVFYLQNDTIDKLEFWDLMAKAFEFLLKK